MTLTPAWYVVRSDALWARWFNVLHWPYTLLHLSFVVLGAAAAPEVHYQVLGGALLCFLLGMGIAAHCFDLLKGDPLRLGLDPLGLKLVGWFALGFAVSSGVMWSYVLGWYLLPVVGFGGFIAAAYNMEWFAGRFHTAGWFASAWGAFPFAAVYLAHDQWNLVVLVGGMVVCYALSRLQRELSTPVRHHRRHLALMTDETRAMERALAWLCVAGPLVAVLVLATHF